MNSQKMHRPIWFPLPTWQVCAAFVLTCVLTLLFGDGLRGQRSWDPLTWNLLEYHWREATLPAMLIGAAWGAWTSVPERTASVIVGGVAARPAAKRAGRLLAILIAVEVLGFILGMVPLLVQTMIYATAGSPEPIGLVTAVMSVATWPAVGYLTGLLARTKFSPLIALALCFIVTFAPAALSASGVSFLAAAPIWNTDFPYLGFTLAPGVALARLGIFILTGLALIAAVIFVAQRVDMRRWLGLAVLLIPAIAAVGVMIPQPNLQHPDASDETICQTRQNLRICVDSRQKDALEPNFVALGGVLQMFDPDHKYFYNQSAIDPTDRKAVKKLAGDDIDLSSGGSISTRHLDEYISGTRDDASDFLSGADSCDPRDFNSFSSYAAQYLSESTNLAATQDNPQFEWPYDKFNKEQLVGWYQKHRAAAQSCEITPQMLHLDPAELSDYVNG